MRNNITNDFWCRSDLKSVSGLRLKTGKFLIFLDEKFRILSINYPRDFKSLFVENKVFND